MKKGYHMSYSIKKNRALIVSASEHALANSETSHRFIGLIKAYGLDAILATEVMASEDVSNVDYIFIDLSQVPLKGQFTEQALKSTTAANVIFFNASEDKICESSALLSGVKGIFYLGDKPDLILKGLEALLNEEPWFKRATMNKAVNDLLKLQRGFQQRTLHSGLEQGEELNLPQLTKREQTIVRLVSSGAQNKEIAEQLHISPNTVKTHIYSLFRKTSSRNRIELITWSQQFNTAQPLNS